MKEQLLKVQSSIEDGGEAQVFRDIAKNITHISIETYRDHLLTRALGIVKAISDYASALDDLASSQK